MRKHLPCCAKDEGWPLDSVNQMEESNRLMRLALRVLVVSDKEKVGKTCQVSNTEMNVSEPLMRYRNGIGCCQNGCTSVAPGRVATQAGSGRSGSRYGGGMTVLQALAWNMGTCRSDDKGETAR